MEPDSKHEGNSLVPLLRDPESQWTNMARTSFGPGNYSIVTEQYRFIRYADGSEEFYDHATDPQEWYNAIDLKKYAAIIDQHRQEIPQERHDILGKGSTGHKSFSAAHRNTLE